MITAKRLVLLLLTGLLMASIACGPSAEELKQVARCEDALERRNNAETNLANVQAQVAVTDFKTRIMNGFEISSAEDAQAAIIEEALKDVDKYCK